MKKIKMYTYLGTNGTITTPVHLENIYSVVKYQLIAEDGYQLTKDNKTFVDRITVNSDEVELWHETPSSYNN